MEVEDYNQTVAKQKSNQKPRRDLLRSYGSAAMIIGQRTYKKIEDQDGTIGWLARKLAFIAFPIFWWIKFQWLSQLSFIDRRIQTLEWISCKIFPQSDIIFSKIDGLATYADSLPDKLDNVIDAIGGFFGELPGLSGFYWVVEVVEEIFKNMMSFLPNFGSSYTDKSVQLDADMNLGYERDENLKKNLDEGLKEGGEILERTDASDREKTKDDSIVAEGKLSDRVQGESLERTDAANSEKTEDASIVSEGNLPDRVEGENSERTDAVGSQNKKDNSIVSEGKSDQSKSKGDDTKKGRKKKGKMK